MIRPLVFAQKNPLPLKVAVLRHFPPQYSLDQEGRPTGFAIDVIQQLSKICDFKIEYIIKDSWSDMYEALETGEADIIPNMGVTDSRMKRFSLSTPVEVFHISIFVRSKDFSIKNKAALKKKNTAVVRHNAGKTIADKLKLNNIKVFETPEKALFSLLSGNSDVIIYPAPVLWKMARKARISDKIKVVGRPLSEIKRAVAVNLKNHKLLDRLNIGIKKLLKTDEFKKIYKKWHSTPESYWSIKKIIYLFSAIIIIIIFFMALWRYFSVFKLNARLIKNIDQRIAAEKKLHQAYDRSEEMVAERTAELTDLNKSLKEEIAVREQTESSLRKSEKKYRRLFRSTNDGICLHEMIYDADKAVDYKILDVNPQFEKILGLSREKAVNVLATELYNSNPAPFIDVYDQVVKTGTGKVFETYYPPLKKHFLISAFSPEKNQFATIFKDNTERKKMEEQALKHKNLEALGTLAGGMAHDFNNALAVIMGNLSQAEIAMNISSEFEELISEAMEGCKNAQCLANKFLTFSSGGMPVKDRENIKKFIHDSVCSVLEGTNSKPEFDFEANDVYAEFDAAQMGQVIKNIVLNAHESMRAGGIIKVRTCNSSINVDNPFAAKPGEYVQIDITDQGHGIEKENLSKVFDPYYSTKNDKDGMGLATAFSIIKSHGGFITLESEVGQGSTFHIFIQLSKSKLNEKKMKANKIKLHQGSGRILIMDDQEQILFMLRKIMDKLGYEAVCTKDGQEAIEKYKQARNSEDDFDLVILDLTVPKGLGGADTMMELKKIDPNVRAIVSSGYSNDPVMANYRDHGFCAVMPKPYSIKNVSDIFKELFQ